VPLLRELACQPKQRFAVGVEACFVRRAALSRRPRIEAFFPAIYARSFLQTMLTMYGRPAIRV
jgi:hypothetical protein